MSDTQPSTPAKSWQARISEATDAIAQEFVEAIGWQVRELVLIDSVVGRHNLLGRWPLG